MSPAMSHPLVVAVMFDFSAVAWVVLSLYYSIICDITVIYNDTIDPSAQTEKEPQFWLIPASLQV